MAKTKHVLNVALRTEKGSANARRLRNAGKIPAVVYSCGKEPRELTVDAQEWTLLSRNELNLITLKEADGKESLVLLKEVQNDFIKCCAMHLDFMEVRKDQKIQAKVALHAGHDAPAGAMFGGILEQNIHEVEVECLPDELPESIEVDVSKLNLGEALHIADIAESAGVKILNNDDVVAFVVIDPNASDDAAPAEAGANEPEIVGAKEKAEKAAAAEEAKKK